MGIKKLYGKFLGGNVGNSNLITSTDYRYDEDTFEFKGSSSLYDGGKKADEEGAYTFDSIKSFIESKGKTELVKLKENQLS